MMQAELSPRAGIGPVLRRARESRGLTLNDVAHTTNIRPRYLRALEEDAPADRFPGEIYARFFMREYARCVGVNDVELVSVLDARVEPPKPTIEPIRELLPPRRWAHRLVTLSAVAVMVGLVAISVASSRFGEDGAADVRLPIVAGPANHPKELGVGYARRAVPIVAELTVEAPTWVQVTSDGEPDVKRYVDPGETLSLEATSTMQVFVQDPDAVRLRVNGQPVAPQGPVLRARFVSERGRIVRT
jgi:transcriptional regulator with XRE-family HTH domain